MDARQLKVQQIVALGITRGPGYLLVPSRSSAVKHKVVLDGLYPSCDCESFELTNRECVHMEAARAWQVERYGGDPAPRTDPAAKVPRKTYKRDWTSLNLAATTEQRWFVRLLSDLTRGVPEPERKPTRGQRPIPLADQLFAAVFKVYSGFSARRFTCALDDAATKGHVGQSMHFNSVLNVFDREDATPILQALITKSASPFRGVDTEWAVDSTGFSARLAPKSEWFNEKYGRVERDTHWVKAHACCSTTSLVVVSAVVLEKHSADTIQFPGLIETAKAAGFRLEQITADKAYCGTPNLNAAEKVGGTLYSPFRSNITGAVGGIFEEAFHYFCLHRSEFLETYHRRSLIETAFSVIKRVFGETVRAKTETAIRNEVAAKIIALNIRQVILGIYELGLNPVFNLPLDGDTTNDLTPDILPFPGCTSLEGPAHHNPA
jgi:transposase